MSLIESGAHRRALRTLLLVWMGLLLLLAATASVSFLPWKDVHAAINLAIAMAKALLIGLFFMNLRSSSTLSRLIAAGGFLWLALLMTLSYLDVWMRGVK